MFSFFKSSIEKDLTKLGYQKLIEGYKKKVKLKEWTKKQYTSALEDLYKKHKNEIYNLNNVNVATRQSFDVADTIVPLNLQNIQQEYIDYDYIYSSLLFEFNNNKQIHAKALKELDKLLQEQYPNTVLLPENTEKLKNIDLKQLINEATTPFSDDKKNYLKAVFNELKNRL